MLATEEGKINYVKNQIIQTMMKTKGMFINIHIYIYMYYVKYKIKCIKVCMYAYIFVFMYSFSYVMRFIIIQFFIFFQL